MSVYYVVIVANRHTTANAKADVLERRKVSGLVVGSVADEDDSERTPQHGEQTID